MKLAHGTSERVARIVLEEGLRPRGETGSKGHWKHTVDSSLETVHLTNSYAGYFAGCAAEPGERWAVIEVDVDTDNLLPDEDFLEQASRGDPLGLQVMGGARTMKDRTKWFRDRLVDFQEHWKDSLEALGTVAHLGAIPPDQITKVALFDASNAPMAWKAMDPTITLLNYKICGGQYRALTQWLLGYAVPPEELFGLFWQGMDERSRIEAIKMANDTEKIELIKG